MSLPVAYQILQAVQTRLQAISLDGGYNTDAGDRVYLGSRRVNPDQLDIGPVINVYDVSDEVDETTAYGDESLHITLQIQVDVFVRDVDMRGTETIHLVIQDVQDALLDITDRVLGDLSLDFGYAGRTIEYPDGGGDTISASLQFSTLYLMPYGTA